MKKIIFFALVLWTIQACCTKKDCSTGLYEISIRGFEYSEKDTIIILTYEKNSGFTQRLDSTVAQVTESGDGSALIYFSGQLDVNRDYKILFSGLEDAYTLTDFRMGRKGCNSCFPFRPEGDYFDVLEGYRLNGESRNENSLYIFK